jgi:DNA-binding LacI/PurR family transcriptional regulator
MAYPHKSQKIADTIAGWFAEGRYKPGDRFPSDQELAREFAVNHVTVRTALKRFVDAGVLERRVGAGTVVRDPAARKTEAGRDSGGIALAIPDATHSFFSELLRAVEESVLGSGRSLVFGHTWELAKREQQVVATWLGQGVRRMILTPPVTEPDFYRDLLDKGVRLVFVDRKVEGLDLPSIVSRDELGMAAVMKYLAQLGHRRLLHLAGPATIWTAQQRRESFERCGRSEGLRSADLEVLPAGYYLEDGHAAMTRRLAAGAPPEAVVAANDPVAVGAIRALQEAGLRVPEDVTVTGYGDTDLGRNFGLTTVKQFPDRMGTEAVRLVLGTAPLGAADSLEITPELVIRSSTAGPRLAAQPRAS